jgi:hypothetical protein
VNTASGAAVRSRAPVADALRWSAGSLRFELVSPHPEVLDRARVVFGPWLNGSSATGPAPPAQFRIEREDDPGRRWRVIRDGQELSVSESLDLALAAVEYGAIARLHEPGSEVLAVHSALLSRDGAGILLVGPKESGKSTLACALWRSGWRLHSDDNALIEDGARARGIPRRVSLRTTSRPLVGAELWERILRLPGTTRTRFGVLFHPSEAAPDEAPPDVPVTAIAFLARRGANAGPGRVEALDAGRALLALAPYSSRRERGIGHALEALQPLAHRAPAFDLGRGPLPDMMARVEEITTA